MTEFLQEGKLESIWRRSNAIDHYIENVPDQVHSLLRKAALDHRRSVNSEAIVCLEQVLLSRPRESVEDELRRIRALRAGIPPINLSNDEVNELKNAGRR